ncbi:zinc finger CCCH domain-containing protein 11A-like protein [Dinothrombium tinctorium]|uniref:Zinc finger CCCH domain-containing protein 11A-like protein n=1 Tax=Dinothrombium tinctorium TaxID=1965070 RepID=A0A443QHX3_9ACAR|nr:zinc finger CCCH domain-containing protein 11A-like protein [Dinothrombium tinctorium]
MSKKNYERKPPKFGSRVQSTVTADNQPRRSSNSTSSSPLMYTPFMDLYQAPLTPLDQMNFYKQQTQTLADNKPKQTTKPKYEPQFAEDCVYFFRGHCEKGEKCKFRHQEAARQATIICKYWRRGECTNLNCSFLHTKSLPSKESVRCHFELKNGNCEKANCDYLHEKKSRANTASSSSDLDEIATGVAYVNISPKDYFCCDCGNKCIGFAYKFEDKFICLTCGHNYAD